MISTKPNSEIVLTAYEGKIMEFLDVIDARSKKRICFPFPFFSDVDLLAKV